MDIVITLIGLAIVVEALTEVLVSPISIVYLKVWKKVQTCGYDYIEKLSYCPWCTSLWISFLVCFTWLEFSFWTLGYSLIAWRLANWIHTVVSYVEKKKLFMNAGVED